MSNKEVLSIIKEVNALVDTLNMLEVNSEEYGSVLDLLNLNLDLITIDCPRWKYHRAWELHMSHKSGHYWVTFTQ